MSVSSFSFGCVSTKEFLLLFLTISGCFLACESDEYISVELGATIALSCHTPTTDVDWQFRVSEKATPRYIYSNGVIYGEFSEQNRFSVSKTGAFRSTWSILHIRNATFSESGLYTCIEDSGASPDQRNMLVIVYVNATAGDNVTLTCRSKTDDVDWVYSHSYPVSGEDHVYSNYQLYEKFRSSGRYSVTSGHGTYDLRITNVSKENVGIYVCVEHGGFGDHHLRQLFISGHAPDSCARCSVATAYINVWLGLMKGASTEIFLVVFKSEWKPLADRTIGHSDVGNTLLTESPMYKTQKPYKSPNPEDQTATDQTNGRSNDTADEPTVYPAPHTIEECSVLIGGTVKLVIAVVSTGISILLIVCCVINCYKDKNYCSKEAGAGCMKFRWIYEIGQLFCYVLLLLLFLLYLCTLGTFGYGDLRNLEETLSTSTTVLACWQIMSVAHLTNSKMCKRMFSAMNILVTFRCMTVIVLYPIELTAGLMSYLVHFNVSAISMKNDMAVGVNHSIVRQALQLYTKLISQDLLGFRFSGSAAFVPFSVGLGLSVFLLPLLMIMNSVSFTRIVDKSVIKKTVNAELPGRAAYFTGYITMVIGAVLAMLVQSGVVFAIVLIVLVGVGVMKKKQFYPIILGSYIGLTIISLLDAIAYGCSKFALLNPLYDMIWNITGIILLYSFPCLRIPLQLSKWLTKTASHYPWFVLLYYLVSHIALLLVYGGVPLALLPARNLASTLVTIPFCLIVIIVIVIHVLQSQRPLCLPAKLRSWDFLPLCLHSLEPADRFLKMALDWICRFFKTRVDWIRRLFTSNVNDRPAGSDGAVILLSYSSIPTADGGEEDSHEDSHDRPAGSDGAVILLSYSSIPTADGGEIG